MINVGIAGIGFMGWIHYLAYRGVDEANLVAFWSRDEQKRLGKWAGIKGNFPPPSEDIDVSDLRAHATLEALLADDEVDLVDICLPPAHHYEAVMATLKAGKHVFCEKPLALDAQQCDEMVQAADDAGRLLLVGQVLPFLPEYAHARELIDQQTSGRLLGGTFKRVISDPQWIADFFDPTRVGGPLVDLHVHDAHLIRLLMGMPAAVSSVGRMRGEVVEYCNTLFHYDDPSLVVSAVSGVIQQQGRGFTHGFEMHLERATLQYEMAVVGDAVHMLMPLTIFDDQGGVNRPELGDGDMVKAFEAEVREVVDSIQKGQASPVLGGELARDAITLCHKQTESVRRGQRVAV